MAGQRAGRAIDIGKKALPRGFHRIAQQVHLGAEFGDNAVEHPFEARFHADRVFRQPVGQGLPVVLGTRQRRLEPADGIDVDCVALFLERIDDATPGRFQRFFPAGHAAGDLVRDGAGTRIHVLVEARGFAVERGRERFGAFLDEEGDGVATLVQKRGDEANALFQPAFQELAIFLDEVDDLARALPDLVGKHFRLAFEAAHEATVDILQQHGQAVDIAVDRAGQRIAVLVQRRNHRLARRGERGVEAGDAFRKGRRDKLHALADAARKLARAVVEIVQHPLVQAGQQLGQFLDTGLDGCRHRCAALVHGGRQRLLRESERGFDVADALHRQHVEVAGALVQQSLDFARPLLEHGLGA